MSLTVVKGMQSEIFVPITPPSVWAPVTKPLSEMKIALATAAGVHHKDDKRFNLAGDFSFREVRDNMLSSDLMVSIGGVAPVHIGFMGGGGNQQKFKEETGPEIARILKEEGVDGVLLTAG